MDYTLELTETAFDGVPTSTPPQLPFKTYEEGNRIIYYSEERFGQPGCIDVFYSQLKTKLTSSKLIRAYYCDLGDCLPEGVEHLVLSYCNLEPGFELPSTIKTIELESVTHYKYSDGELAFLNEGIENVFFADDSNTSTNFTNAPKSIKRIHIASTDQLSCDEGVVSLPNVETVIYEAPLLEKPYSVSSFEGIISKSTREVVLRNVHLESFKGFPETLDTFKCVNFSFDNDDDFPKRVRKCSIRSDKSCKIPTSSYETIKIRFRLSAQLIPNGEFEAKVCFIQNCLTIDFDQHLQTESLILRYCPNLNSFCGIGEVKRLQLFHCPSIKDTKHIYEDMEELVLYSTGVTSMYYTPRSLTKLSVSKQKFDFSTVPRRVEVINKTTKYIN